MKVIVDIIQNTCTFVVTYVKTVSARIPDSHLYSNDVVVFSDITSFCTVDAVRIELQSMRCGSAAEQ